MKKTLSGDMYPSCSIYVYFWSLPKRMEIMVSLCFSFSTVEPKCTVQVYVREMNAHWPACWRKACCSLIRLCRADH